VTAAVEQLGRQRPTRRQWRTWTSQDATLAGLDYDRLRHELRHSSDDRQDELLTALVRLARGKPEVVAVVVACLWPGLRALVTRYARGLEPSEGLAVAVAGLCKSIARYSLDGQTSFVANRLLRLPRRHLQRAAKEQDAWRRHCRDVPDRAGTPVQVELRPTTCLRLAVDAGVLTTADAWLIHATRVAGHTVRWAARRLGIGYEAAKKRRQRAEARWAARWAPEARQRHLIPFSIDPQHQEVA
jgi:hypothetical protein